MPAWIWRIEIQPENSTARASLERRRKGRVRYTKPMVNKHFDSFTRCIYPQKNGMFHKFVRYSTHTSIYTIHICTLVHLYVATTRGCLNEWSKEREIERIFSPVGIKTNITTDCCSTLHTIFFTSNTFATTNHIHTVLSTSTPAYALLHFHCYIHPIRILI